MSKLTETRTHVTGFRGKIPIVSAWPAATAVETGDMAYNTTDGRLGRFNGTNWEVVQITTSTSTSTSTS